MTDVETRTEIGKMKIAMLGMLKQQHGDHFDIFISPAVKAFDAVQLCEI